MTWCWWLWHLLKYSAAREAIATKLSQVSLHFSCNPFQWVNTKSKTIQSNLCITTTWGTKFLWLLKTGGRYKEGLCITAKTVNSDIWSLYKGMHYFWPNHTLILTGFLEKEKPNKYVVIKQHIINNFKTKISWEFIITSGISTLRNKKPGTSFK